MYILSLYRPITNFIEYESEHKVYTLTIVRAHIEPPHSTAQ